MKELLDEAISIFDKAILLLNTIACKDAVGKHKEGFDAAQRVFQILDASYPIIGSKGQSLNLEDASVHKPFFDFIELLANPPSDIAAHDDFQGFKEKLEPKVHEIVSATLSDILKPCLMPTSARQVLLYMMAKSTELDLEPLQHSDSTMNTIRKAKGLCEVLLRGLQGWSSKVVCIVSAPSGAENPNEDEHISAPLWLCCSIPDCCHLTFSLKVLMQAYEVLCADAAPVYEEFVGQLLKMSLEEVSGRLCHLIFERVEPRCVIQFAVEVPGLPMNCHE